MKKKTSLMIITLLLIISGCTTDRKETDPNLNLYSYGNSSELSTKSRELIDNSITYEVFFRLEEKTECISVNIESVYLHKSFPVQKIPKKSFFNVEKEINLKHGSLKSSIRYIPVGRNYNNEWETFSPVKICTVQTDPLSVIDASRYRIRFTTFEKLPVYYVITINSDKKIVIPDNNQ